MLLRPLLLLEPENRALKAQILIDQLRVILQTPQTIAFRQVRRKPGVISQASIPHFLIWEHPWLAVSSYAVVLVDQDAWQPV